MNLAAQPMDAPSVPVWYRRPGGKRTVRARLLAKADGMAKVRPRKRVRWVPAAWLCGQPIRPKRK